jgi:hypothetical protein
MRFAPLLSLGTEVGGADTISGHTSCGPIVDRTDRLKKAHILILNEPVLPKPVVMGGAKDTVD